MMLFGALAMKTDTTDKAIYFQRQFKYLPDQLKMIRNKLDFKCGVCSMVI